MGRRKRWGRAGSGQDEDSRVHKRVPARPQETDSGRDRVWEWKGAGGLSGEPQRAAWWCSVITAASANRPCRRPGHLGIWNKTAGGPRDLWFPALPSTRAGLCREPEGQPGLRHIEGHLQEPGWLRPRLLASCQPPPAHGLDLELFKVVLLPFWEVLKLLVGNRPAKQSVSSNSQLRAAAGAWKGLLP